MGKEAYKNFIEKKEQREEFIRKMTDILNDTLKKSGIDKEYKAEDLINRANDPKRQQNYIKSNEIFADIEDKRNYQTFLKEKYNLNYNPGYVRSIYAFIELPKKGEVFAEVEKRNLEAIKKYTTDNENIRETIKEDFDRLMSFDKTKYYPKNIDEAFDSYEKYNKDLELSFCFKSVVQNGGFSLNKELQSQVDYYMSTIEDGSKCKSMFEAASSPITLFMPDDISTEVAYKVMQNSADLISLYPDIVDSRTDYSYYFNYISSKDDNQIESDIKRDFFEKHGSDFITKYKIGGKNFSSQLLKLAKEKKDVEKEIVDGSKEYFLGTVKPFYSKDAANFFNVKKQMGFTENDIKTSTKNVNDLAKDIFTSEKISDLDMISTAFYYHYANNYKNFIPSCGEFIERVDGLVNEGKIKKELFNNYVKVLDDDISFESIEKIDENGIKFVPKPNLENDNPNIEFVNKIAYMKYEQTTLNKNYRDHHFSQEKADEVAKYIEYESKLDYYRSYIANEFQLKKDCNLNDALSAVAKSNKVLPKGLFEQLDKEAEKHKFDTYEKEKFDAFKQKHTGEDVSDIENALRSTKPKYNDTFEKMETPYEQASYVNTGLDQLDSFFKENPEVKPYISNHGDSYDYDIVNGAEFNNKITEHKLSLSDTTKANIKAVVKKMQDTGIFNPDQIDPQLKLKGEQPFKIYGLQKLSQKRIELVDSLEKNNTELAHQKAKEVEETIKEYNELYDFVEKTLPQDGMHCPGNVATFRNPDHPFDVQQRYQPQMQVNGLYNMLVYCNANDIDPNDFIDNPQKQIEDLAERKMKETNDYYSVNQNVTDKGNKKYLMGVALARIIKDSPSDQNHLGPGRAFESILALETDANKVKDNTIAQLFDKNIITNPIDNKSRMFESLDAEDNSRGIYSDYKTMKEYMALGENYPITSFMTDTVNLKTGERNKKEYDYEKFVKEDKRSIKEIYEDTMDKMTHAINNIQLTHEVSVSSSRNTSAFVASTMAYFNDVLKERNVDLSKDKDALEMKNFIDNPQETLYKAMEDRFGVKYDKDSVSVDYTTGMEGDLFNHIQVVKEKGLLDYYKGLSNTHETYSQKMDEFKETSTFDLTDKFDKDLKAKSFKESSADLLSMAHVLNERNNSRTIFGKIFRPSAWKERRVLKEIKNMATKNGISKEEYDRYLNLTNDGENKNYVVSKGLGLVNRATAQIIETEKNNPIIERKTDEVKLMNIDDKDLESDIVNEKDNKITSEKVNEKVDVKTEDKVEQIQADTLEV